MWQQQVAAYRESLALMPDGPFRRFAEWAAGRPGCAERWLQLNGLAQNAKMAEHLVSGLFDAAELNRLAGLFGGMNAHLVCEMASDHLAIGLADPPPHDLGAAERRELLVGFNNATMHRLAGGGSGEAREAVLALRPLAHGVSFFRQSLGGGEFQTLADAFERLHPGERAEEVAADVLPVLTANIECTVAQVENVRGLASEELVRSGLVRRYAGVNRLLTKELTAEELLSTGLDTSLAISTLGYVAGVIAELVRPNPAFAEAIDRIEATLESAALILRLLNDCGTPLMEQQAVRDALLARLAATLSDAAVSADAATLRNLLLDAGPRDALARLRKDVVHGESNVCLDGLRNLPATPDALRLFGERLALAATRYRTASTVLNTQLRCLSRQLGDATICTMIARCVSFHRRMYARAYEDGVDGEYAVALPAVE
ncbi:hypothetical protein [Streptomyces sp. FIT100]|uniref:hypothetical protein n=1 Tax=Streptomyces sp. FIT100 TaxID=2837956 RepID=UPI0021C80F71|nr:hypothetical protein [Streptomyces sp. FIT100]UUN29844.1 hypothetical protein KK483_28285 [Streptomyces sp. FIT100]